MTQGFTLDYVSKQPGVIHCVETAVAAAKALAHARGEAVPIVRMDDVRVALVWPDGKVDVTVAGTSIAA